jgi:hypothetical protein
MDKLIAWFTSGGLESILVIVGLVASILSTIFTRYVKAPQARERGLKGVDYIKIGMRALGGSKYADEVGKWSVPLISPMPSNVVTTDPNDGQPNPV